MAQRRMFSLRLTNSSKFLKMPLTSQCLYFHLSLNADDDGVVEAYNILRLSGCNEDDLKILAAKQFVFILNEDLVTFILDWNEHNLIRSDRKIDSKYKDLLIQSVPNVKLLETKTRSDVTLACRKEAMNNSDLPYSFSYKIRQAFFGEKCPICGTVMEWKEPKIKDFFPSIQHNIPLSLGGKHELGNISVICRRCNASKQDRPTGKLNADAVSEVWLSIIGQSIDRPMTAQVRLGKVRLGKETYSSLSSENQLDSQHEQVIENPDYKKKSTVKIPYEEIMRLYETILGDDLPSLKFLSESRRKTVRVRWSNQLPALEDWEKFFKRIARSDFLTGKTQSKTNKPFIANFDWLLKEANCIKILEGNYDNGWRN